MKETGVPHSQLKRWRRVTRKDIEAEPVINQRALERELARRWRCRILARLTPYRDQIPALTRAGLEEDRDIADHDVFGTARHGTLASHARTLDKMIAL